MRREFEPQLEEIVGERTKLLLPPAEAVEAELLCLIGSLELADNDRALAGDSA